MNEEIKQEQEQEVIEPAAQEGIGQEEEIQLPSEEATKFAGTFGNVDELKKGIDNLGTNTLPDYVMAGMSDDALEKHYIELRKEYSKPKEEEKKEEEKPKEEEPTENNKGNKPDSVSDDLWAQLDTSFRESGGITQEHYAELEKAGIPAAVADKYLDGLKAEQNVFTQNIYDIAGGKDAYEEIKEWAESNYTDAEMRVISSGSYEEIAMKMKGVKADFIAKNGQTPDRLRGNQGSNGQKGYADQGEYLRDVMSPEYKKNAKYKAKVQAKFANSFFAE